MKTFFLVGLLTLNSSVILAHEIVYSNPVVTSYQVPAEACTCKSNTVHVQNVRVDGELTVTKKEKSRGAKALATAGTVLGIVAGTVAIICISAVITGPMVFLGLMWIFLGGLR